MQIDFNKVKYMSVPKESGEYAVLEAILPANYTQVEYIESTGPQYIDTGVLWDTNDLRMQGIYKYTALSGHASIFGTQGHENGSNLILREESGTLRWWFGTTNATITAVAANQLIDFDLELKNLGTYSYNVQINNNVLATYSGAGEYTSVYDGDNIYLFDTQINDGRGSEAASTITCKARLYTYKIFKDGELVRNFVPCKNPIGEVGLYDQIENKFYANSGTGTFGAGPNVTSTSVKYISDSNGNILWYSNKIAAFNVSKITATTYNATDETTYPDEKFVLFDIYPKTNGSVKVTYGGLTKTIIDTSGAASPQKQQVFFGTFNGVSDTTETPDSGILTIEGDYDNYTTGTFKKSSSGATTYCNSVSRIISLGHINKILNRAFYECSNLQAVNIFSGIIEIGQYAFYKCSSLKVALLPQTLTTIDSSAFAYTALSTLKIPYGVTTIGNSVFSNCKLLTSVYLPNSITSIGTYAFSYCTQLPTVTIPRSLSQVSGYIFNYCTSLQNVTIQEGVTKISNYAFNYCENLGSLHLPSSVSSITGAAVHKCNNLTSLTVDENNTTYYSQSNCIINTNNTLVVGCKTSVIPSDGTVTTIGEYAFTGCDGLTSLSLIPVAVTSIGNYAFLDCFGLENIEIHDQVKTIGEGAFKICKSAINLVIGAGVTSIKSQAFVSCQNLASITVNSSNTRYYHLQDCLLDRMTQILIAGCQNSQIPANGQVVEIGSYAFAGHSNLKSIIIPDTVMYLGSYSFSGTGLQNIIIPDKVITIDTRAFMDCRLLASVTIGSGVQWICPGAFANTPLKTAIFKTHCDWRRQASPTATTGTRIAASALANPATAAQYLRTTLINYYLYCIYEESAPGIYAIKSDSTTSLAASWDQLVSAGVDITIDYANASAAKSSNASLYRRFTALASSSGSFKLVIPNTVTKIGDFSFTGCAGLKQIVLPTGLNYIGLQAASGCTNLSVLVFRQYNPSWFVTTTKTATSGTTLNSLQLSNPATLANLLKSTHLAKYWKLPGTEDISQTGTLVYNGQTQSPELAGYDSSIMTMTGTTSAINAGTYGITIARSNGTWSDGTSGAKTIYWTIEKAEGSVTLSSDEATTISPTTTSFTIINSSGGSLSATSSDTTIATASISRTDEVTVTPVGRGTATITITSAATTNYNAASAEYTITVLVPWTITLECNGGSVSGAPTSYLPDDLPIILPTPTKSGYKFLGWYSSADFSGSPVTNIPEDTASNLTFYAKWVQMVTISYYKTCELNDAAALLYPNGATGETGPVTGGPPDSYGYFLGAKVFGPDTTDIWLDFNTKFNNGSTEVKTVTVPITSSIIFCLANHYDQPGTGPYCAIYEGSSTSSTRIAGPAHVIVHTYGPIGTSNKTIRANWKTAGSATDIVGWEGWGNIIPVFGDTRVSWWDVHIT